MLLEISRIKNGGKTKIKKFSEYLQVIFETDENSDNCPTIKKIKRRAV